MMTKEKFAQIYEEFSSQLYGYVFRRVNDYSVTEDLVSQVFFKALRNINKYNENKGKISTWLYTITSNTLIDYYRKDEQYETIEEYEDCMVCEENYGNEMDTEMCLEKVMQALSKLPIKTQEIITLRIFEELSFVDIAKIIGIGESGAKMSFARGIEIIKNSMNLIVLFISLLIS